MPVMKRLADAMAGDHKQAPYDEIFAELRKYYREEQIVAPPRALPDVTRSHAPALALFSAVALVGALATISCRSYEAKRLQASVSARPAVTRVFSL